jgi:hypothetical protein
MLRTAKSLNRHRITAKDGEIGKLSDLLFDDRAWTIRYFVIDTRRWLPANAYR